MIAMRSPSVRRKVGSRDNLTSCAITGTVASISWYVRLHSSDWSCTQYSVIPSEKSQSNSGRRSLTPGPILAAEPSTTSR